MKPAAKNKTFVIHAQTINRPQSAQDKKQDKTPKMNWGCRLKIEG